MIPSTPSRGRPRSTASRDAILEAAFAVLTARGYAAMSIEAVAEAAGAGKATIYRWWSSRAELAVDAFFHASEAELRLPQTDDPRADFRSQITELADFLRGPRGHALAAMLGGARGDPSLTEVLNARWREPRRRWGFERMSRAKAEGWCSPGVDVMAALGLMYGALYTPLLFGQDVPSRAQVQAHLEIAFAGIFSIELRGVR